LSVIDEWSAVADKFPVDAINLTPDLLKGLAETFTLGGRKAA
jgi:hypothetical protein